MFYLGVAFIKELIDNYRLETCWSYQVSAFIILNRRMLFIFVTHACGWLLSYSSCLMRVLKIISPLRRGQLLEYIVIGLRVRVYLVGLRVNALMRIICARVLSG